MELMDGFEPSTSPLPRVCSTPELHERNFQRNLERAAGIEPASSAWKAEVLPLNYARLPAFYFDKHHIDENWWRGKDSNLRSFRGRFTVCSLWPLGNPSNKAEDFTFSFTTVKYFTFNNLYSASFMRRSGANCVKAKWRMQGQDEFFQALQHQAHVALLISVPPALQLLTDNKLQDLRIPCPAIVRGEFEDL